MNAFLEPFLEEARELVEQASADLLALDETPDDAARLDGAFRAFHTLKGSAGIVEFPAMARACHAVEDALAAVRSGDEPLTQPVIDGALACLGQIGRWLDAIEKAGEPPPEAEGDADRVVAMLAGETGAAPAAVPIPDAAGAILEAQAALLASGTADGFEGRVASAGRVAANVLRQTGRDAAAAEIDRALSESLAAGTARPLAAAIAGLFGAEAAPQAAAPAAGARTLRVPVERIDALVDLTGELTVVKNALGHLASLARDGDDPRHVAAALREQQALLDRLVRDLQQSVLQVRVLPLRFAFRRFPRLVRELAAGLGKPVRLEITGEETEADKAVVEALSEPLLHVLRNAIDHGVEAPAERAARGKPPVATIALSGARAGQDVVVAVTDDGAGIDLAKLRAAAAARGAPADAMSDEAALELIFAPGLSTAQEVTGLSGRGVGMDAVRTAIGRVGGRVEVESRPGRGTRVRFVLPYTVMMTSVMTVEAGGQVFGIPLEAVVETASLARDRIAQLGAARAFVLRGRTIPLLDLAEALGAPAGPAPDGETPVVVALTDGQPTGYAVDRLGGRLDVLLKPMEGLLAGTQGVVGTTLTGDGRVLLVLDLQELVR